MGITYSEFPSVALVIQNAMGMGHIVFYGLSDSVVLSTLSHNKYNFRKKLFLNANTCCDFLRHFSDIVFILKRNK